MKVLVVVSCLLAVAAATPGLVGSPLAYAAPYGAHYAAPYAAHYAAPYAAHYAAPYAAAVVAPTVTSQFHAQDELGQYSYGYQGDTSAKQEVRTADGVTRGGYSYLDANGIVQSASYVSDPVNGFRVAATNLPVGPAAPAAPVAPVAVAAPVAAPIAVAHGAPLPVADTPEVVAAKAAHFQAHAAAKAALLGRKKRSPGLIAAPVAAYHAPAAVAAYHAPAAVATYAAPAAYAYAAPALVAPARSFGYSSVTAHPGHIVAAHPGAVVIA